MFIKNVWTKIKNIYFMYLKSTVFNRENLRLGANSTWSQGCLLNCYGGLSIGRNVLIGPNVVIHTANHNYQDPTTLIRLQGHTPEPVIIEDDVWIGANAVVLPGVKLCRGCVVGAGSVVTKTVPAYTVVAGNPARILKKRKIESECFV